MSIAWDAPGSVEFHTHDGEARVIEDAMTKRALVRLFRSELRHDDQRCRVVRTRQRGRRAKNLSRDTDPALDRRLSSVPHYESQDFQQTRTCDGGLPHQPRSEMRAV